MSKVKAKNLNVVVDGTTQFSRALHSALKTGRNEGESKIKSESETKKVTFSDTSTEKNEVETKIKSENETKKVKFFDVPTERNEVETKIKSESKTKSKIESETKIKSESKTKIKSESKTKSKIESETKTVKVKFSDAPKGDLNLIHSPFSASMCFALLKVGSKGLTSKEMKTTFNFPANDAVLCSGVQQIFQSLKTVESGILKTPELNIVSSCKIFHDEKFKMLETYKEILWAYFGMTSDITKIELKPTTALKINSWVENLTQHRIKGVISPLDLDPSRQPKILLMHAIYFKGVWLDEFNECDTYEQDFYTKCRPTENDAVRVSMMHKPRTLINATVLERIDAQVFELPFKGKRFSMVIYVPNSINGLSKIEDILHLPDFCTLFFLMKEDHYELYVPKFKFETSLDLTQILPSMGVRTVFTGGNFNGMKPDDKEAVFITSAVQKVTITVDEKGVEAAATTSNYGLWRMDNPSGTSNSEKKHAKVLNAHHPFFYQIVDKTLKMILFAGTCSDPTFSK